MSKYCNCKSPSCYKCSDPATCTNVGEGDNSKAVYESLKNLKIDNACCGKGYCGVPGDGGSSGSGDCGPQKFNETIPDKLMFTVEWYENGADLIKKYLLIYYGVDGTCEVKDIINNQRFLRRLKLETVSLNQLYLGNIINIYGRSMTLVEYADTCTQQYLEVRSQKAFLLIKPHAVQCLGRILQEIEKSGELKVLRARMARMTPDLVAQFYEQYKSEEFYKRILTEMTSGPVVAFLIVGRYAIEKLLCMAGDIDPAVAKLKHPESFRAVYGQEFAVNAVHVSESPACVERDSSPFFTTCRTALPFLAEGTALMKCSTCCVIKPHAVKEGFAGSIIDSISRANYKITAFELFYLDRSHAEEFYEIYKGVLPEYSEMTAELALGPCYVLEISGCGENTPANFREFVGPQDPIIARKLRPTSLRARFGSSTVKNAVHCSDLCEDAEMEVDYFFRILQMV